MAEVGTIGRTYHINLVASTYARRAVKALVYEYMVNGLLDRHLFGTPAPDGRVIEFDKLHEIAVGTAKAVLHEVCTASSSTSSGEASLLGADMAPKGVRRAHQAVWRRTPTSPSAGAGTPSGCRAVDVVAVTQKSRRCQYGIFVVRDAR
ncbi:hypothetical protein ZWY2020_011348 [Hordeum vulgare]|nr:hypothetical protein ZWY2020_011348 [Hordeum vulgare]